LLLEASGGSTGATSTATGDQHSSFHGCLDVGVSHPGQPELERPPVLSTRPRHAAFPPLLEYGNKSLEHPLLSGVPWSATAHSDATRIAHERAEEWQQRQGGTLLDRARREDAAAYLVPARKRDRKSSHRPPRLLVHARDGSWKYPASARPDKAAKAIALHLLGLTKKADRELGCGLLWAEAECGCRSFKVAYRCNSRFCVDCAAPYSRDLFKRAWERIEPVAAVLAPCWPLHPGAKVHRGPVVSKIDFTLRTTGELSTVRRNRELGRSITKFFAACEREFGIPHGRYGCAYQMETSQAANGRTKNGRAVLGNMSHAHAVYVGPWLPNKKRQLSRIWREVTPDRSFTVSIKTAKNLAQALGHATKYPRKLVRQSTPERLAELEKSYSRVRMFRMLGAFDKRIAERILTAAANGEAFHFPQFKRVSACPFCGGAVEMCGTWRFLADLAHLEDVEEVRRRIGREKVFAGPHGPPGGGT
jgi:hypothetical protein